MITPIVALLDWERQLRAALQMERPVLPPLPPGPAWLLPVAEAHLDRARLSALFPRDSVERMLNLAGMPDLPVGAVLDGSQVLGTWSADSDWDVSSRPVTSFEGGRLDVHADTASGWHRFAIRITAREMVGAGAWWGAAHFGEVAASTPWPAHLAPMGRFLDWLEGLGALVGPVPTLGEMVAPLPPRQWWTLAQRLRKWREPLAAHPATAALASQLAEFEAPVAAAQEALRKAEARGWETELAFRACSDAWAARHTRD